jgi:hypothetical protein
MKPDTTVRLGDFEFSRFEVPEKIPFGGDQRLIVHELVGGVRVIDAMGPTPMPLEWSGVFTGQSGLDRARYVDGLRKTGKPLTLSWDEFLFSVVIRTFQCEFKSFYRVPYRIVCEVVEDKTTPVTDIASPGIDTLVKDDLATANALASAAGNAAVSAQMALVSTAIANIPDFATAPPRAISAALQPIDAARTLVIGSLAQANAIIQSVSTVGGVVPGALAANQVTGLNTQIAAVSQSPALINLDRALGRMRANIGAVNNSAQVVNLVGGNLYAVASNQYGDATAFTAIMQANQLTDPQISGLTSLVVPSRANQTGGILNA